MNKTQQSPETYHLSFLITEWIRIVSEGENSCHNCESTSARFLSEIYGYEGFEADDEQRRAKQENAEIGSETFIEDAVFTIQKIYEAQSRGIYRVMGRQTLCGLCVAARADCHLGMDHAGTLTVTQMISSKGKISCLVGLHFPWMNSEQGIPLLLSTQARTLNDLLSVVRSPLVLLDEKREC